MEKTYAIIQNNLVTNVIVAEQDFIDNHYPGAIRIDTLESQPSIGWKYENNSFINTQESSEELNQTKSTTYSKLEFRQKFTLAELIKIDNYEQYELTDIQKQTMKVINNNFAMSSYIDLSDPLTIQSLNYLVEIRFLTQERLEEILK